jgi:hypothetical protein
VRGEVLPQVSTTDVQRTDSLVSCGSVPLVEGAEGNGLRCLTLAVDSQASVAEQGGVNDSSSGDAAAVHHKS